MNHQLTLGLRRPLVAVILFVVVTFLVGTLAPPVSAVQDGWRKASSVEKRQLKKAAKRGRGNAKVTRQYGWFVTTRTSPRYGIVCGRAQGTPINRANIGGAIFKLRNGNWRYQKANTSGELQTIFTVCR